MRNIFLISVFCLCYAALNAQNTSTKAKLSEGAALLFKNVKTTLTAEEKNHLYRKVGLKLSPDKKAFFIDEYDVEVRVFATDMNKDGTDEIFVGFNSVALFGNMGENYSLFIKDKAGTYQQEPDIAGGQPIILKTSNLAYPDLLIGGPGFEFPVYRWNGKTYVYHRIEKDGILNNGGALHLDEYQKK